MSTRFQNGIVCSRRCPMGCVMPLHARDLISSRDRDTRIIRAKTWGVRGPPGPPATTPLVGGRVQLYIVRCRLREGEGSWICNYCNEGGGEGVWGLQHCIFNCPVFTNGPKNDSPKVHLKL